MDEAIRDLLDVLEAAETAGAPLNDTVIREALQDVIYLGFVVQQPGYQVPNDILLNYTQSAEQQNSVVVTALTHFLDRARTAAAASGLDTSTAREAAFLESEAESTSGEVTVGSFFD